jgi:hypothetical protein
MYPHGDPEFLGDPAVVFAAAEDAGPVTLASLAVKAAQAAAPTLIKVRVNEPYRVVEGGKVFVGGQMLSVPDDLEHSRWIESGSVTKVRGK